MSHQALPIPATYLTEALDMFYQLPSMNHVGTPLEVEEQTTHQLKKKKSLKILLTTFWDYPHLGGLSHYLATFKRTFEKMGHVVDIISPNQFAPKKLRTVRRKMRNKLYQFYETRYRHVSPKVLETSYALYSYESLLGEMNLESYDLFHAQDIFTANILARMNLKYKKPLYLTPHGTFTKSRLKFKQIQRHSVEEAFFSAIERRAIAVAKKIVMISDSFRQPLMEYGAKNKQLVTVHTGIDFQAKEPVTNKNKIIMTCVARLSPRKGHTQLLEALATLKRSLSNVEFWIVGDGEMRTALERQAKELELGCVQFKGKRMDIPDILMHSDIFVLPTLNDNLPISVIEAMFAKQAIITTNCGGIREIISHLDTGIIIEPGDVADLAAKILLLLENEKLRKKLAENAQSFADQHLTAKRMAEKIIDVYELEH